MKIFLDSSVLIEYENGRNQALFETLLDMPKLELCLNSVVASEFFYKLLGILGNRSPMAIKESKKIKETLEKHETDSFLSYFTLLDTPKDAIIYRIGINEKT
jgi:predicted nucleic acid-binding protein